MSEKFSLIVQTGKKVKLHDATPFTMLVQLAQQTDTTLDMIIPVISDINKVSTLFTEQSELDINRDIVQQFELEHGSNMAMILKY